MGQKNLTLFVPVVVCIILLLTSFSNSGRGYSVNHHIQQNVVRHQAAGIPGNIPAETLRIALAQLRRCVFISEGVRRIDSVLSVCSREHVDIVCFPETYIPGLRGGGEDSLLPPPDQPAMERALESIKESCRKHNVAVIAGMEWMSRQGLENRAFVISEIGVLLGHQTKNQITPGGEEKYYVPETVRKMFKVKGVPFGVVICHEGWRFPETVRWAAVRGAKIVFQPQVTGSNGKGKFIEKPWGQSYYEMAMVLRSKENSIYFASVNECMKKQNSATSLIDPDGNKMESLPCGTEALLIRDIDISKATGFYAGRYRPERYREAK